MWHSRVLYETSAGSGGRQPQTATSGVNHVPKVSCSSLCDLTPPALAFVISSCQDLLIGSPQAELSQRLYIGKLSIN